MQVKNICMTVVLFAAALVAVADGTALGAERVESSLGEGVRGWISMESAGTDPAKCPFF